MKVLMTADAAGGVWTYAAELMRALPATEFVVASMGPRPDDAQRARLPSTARLETGDYQLEWSDDPWTDVARAGGWLLDLADRQAPDLVHLNGYAHAALHFGVPKIVVGHSDVFSWWRAVKGEAPPPSWSRYHDAVQRGLLNADFIVTPSRAMLDALHENYAFLTPERVIYNGRRPVPAPSGLERNTVFAAGRLWDEAKNLQAVIDAAPRIHAPVVIAGQGGENAPNVRHLGRLDEAQMARAYARAKIYLFPARYEPFGLSVLEAALAGCALILGDIPSLREIWGDAAIFVPPRDGDVIASATNALLEDAGFRLVLAQRAQARAKEFAPDRMAAEYARLYRTLLARDVQPPANPSEAWA